MSDPRCHQNDQYQTRRDWLLRGGGSFGALALTALLQGSTLRAADPTQSEPTVTPAVPGKNSLANKPGHFPAKAKSVIFLFMEGGPSHLDTFDPKPILNELAGKPLPDSVPDVITAMGEFRSPILASKRQWKQHGQSGLWVSDWLPHMAKCADDLAVLRSCWADGINHSTGVCQMNSGSILAGRPCLGSWVTYGLGTVNENLPAFVVMQDNQATVVNGPRNWSAGFMPAVYQGVRLQAGNEPFPSLNPPPGITAKQQQSKLALLKQLNQQHAAARPLQSELDARINSYELAFRMQAEAPAAVDLNEETEETKQLYGIDRKETETFGQQCLLARRLVERGVRFVQLYHGAGSKWDAHSGIEKNHTGLCASSDQPIAGLITDLKRRGLLDSTLIIWGANLVAHLCQRKVMAVIITQQASRWCWLVAASKGARSSAQPTILGCMP